MLDLARGQDCQARILGVCNNNPATVVSCHSNGGGMAYKAPDWSIAWCCSSCHDVIDGRRDAGHYSQDSRDYFWRVAHERTMDAMFEHGLVSIAGSAPRGTARKVKEVERPAYQPPSKIVKHPGVLCR